MAQTDLSTPESRARKRVQDLSSLLWHAGIFLIVNTFLWVQDFAAGGGLDYAYWTTIPWAVGLAFHALAYFMAPSGPQGRTYEKFLEEERQLQDH